MIQGLIGQWRPWGVKHSSSSASRENHEVSEAPLRPDTPDSFHSCVEEPTFSDSINKLPGGTKARQTLSKMLLFDALDVFNNREEILPGDFEALHDAYGNLKAVLAADAVKEILNEPINKSGDYPMDIAARSGKYMAMKLLADSGARTIKTWDSVPALAQLKELSQGYSETPLKEYKSQLHQEPGFKQLMAMMKLSPAMGELQDAAGDSLPHIILKLPIPESDRSNKRERTENWLKTLNLMTDSDVRLNLRNQFDMYPMDGVSRYDSLFPKTNDHLQNAGARSLHHRPQQSEFHQALFDELALLDEYKNRNPKRAEKALQQVEELLQNDGTKQLLNQPDEHGNFPLDYAAQSHSMKAMQLMVEHGAQRLKTWDSVSFMAPIRKLAANPSTTPLKEYKSRLHENTEFQTYLNQIKQSKALGRLQDRHGNTLLHQLLITEIPEKASKPEMTENWLKTMKAVLHCPINVNVANQVGGLPLQYVEKYKILYPETHKLLTKAGAKTSVDERPTLHTGW